MHEADDGWTYGSQDDDEPGSSVALMMPFVTFAMSPYAIGSCCRSRGKVSLIGSARMAVGSWTKVPPCAETDFFSLVSDSAIRVRGWSSVRAS
jgi:hypothetical protein